MDNSHCYGKVTLSPSLGRLLISVKSMAPLCKIPHYTAAPWQQWKCQCGAFPGSSRKQRKCNVFFFFERITWNNGCVSKPVRGGERVAVYLICNCMNGVYFGRRIVSRRRLKVPDPISSARANPAPAVLNDNGPWPRIERRMMDGERGVEETAGEREKGKETDGAGNVVYRTIVSHCPPLRCVTILPLRLRRSHFPLASSPILILSFPVCQFVKAPHHYCQKSRRGANTKAARTMSHIQARTLVHVAHSCVERERLFFFFSSTPTGFWHSAASLSHRNPERDRQAVWTQKNWRLWFSCQTLLAPCPIPKKKKKKHFFFFFSLGRRHLVAILLLRLRS